MYVWVCGSVGVCVWVWVFVCVGVWGSSLCVCVWSIPTVHKCRLWVLTTSSTSLGAFTVSLQIHELIKLVD